MFEDIDLIDELNQVEISSNNVVELFKKQVENDENQEKEILKNLSNLSTKVNTVDLHDYNSNNVYDLNSIKSIAIKYRLRFLPTKYFKNKIPNEAIFKVKALEKANDTSIKQFYILAPSKNFDLEDINKDPLLFAPLSNGKFLLIHKWGTGHRHLPIEHKINHNSMYINLGDWIKYNTYASVPYDSLSQAPHIITRYRKKSNAWDCLHRVYLSSNRIFSAKRFCLFYKNK